MNTNQSKKVVVITGLGGMGIVIAHRLGKEYKLVLADYSQKALDNATAELEGAGFEVHPIQVDISKVQSVRDLAASANALGTFRGIVHTAGVSPVQASTEQIFNVDVIGTANILEEFGKIAQPGSVAVCIASMAGHMRSHPEEVEYALATVPTSELKNLPGIDIEKMDPGNAYQLAKRGNLLRVTNASNEWEKQGGRVVSISPGVILTPMGKEELSGKSGRTMRLFIGMSGTKRPGVPEEIAGPVAFLMSEAASFISGTDLLVDGGVIGAMNVMKRGGVGMIFSVLFKNLFAKFQNKNEIAATTLIEDRSMNTSN